MSKTSTDVITRLQKVIQNKDREIRDLTTVNTALKEQVSLLLSQNLRLQDELSKKVTIKKPKAETVLPILSEEPNVSTE